LAPLTAHRTLSLPKALVLCCVTIAAAPPPQAKPTDDSSFTALIAEGERLEFQRKYVDASDRFRRAWRVAARNGDRAGHAWALARECRATWGADLPERATRVCQQALSVAQAARSQRAEAETSKVLGNLDLNRGDYAQGESRLRRAVSLAAAAGDNETVMASLNNLAVAALEQGRIDEALRQSGAALKVLETFKEASVRMRFAVPYNLAKALEASGDEESARQWLDRAGRSAEETGYPGGLHHVLMESAGLLLRAGDIDGASSYYDRAIAWNEQAPDSEVSVALARRGRASTFEARGQMEEALEGYRGALSVFEKRGAHSFSPATLIAMSRCLGALTRFDEADRALDQAQAMARRMGLGVTMEVARLERAAVLDGRRLKDAEQAFERSGRTLASMGLPSYAARAYAGAARVAEREGDTTRAEKWLLLALAEIEQVQANLPAELRWRFLETAHSTYASLYRIRMRQVSAGGAATDSAAATLAFDVVERERSRDLAEAAHVSRTKATSASEPADPERRLARIQIELLADIPESKRQALLRERADAERDLMLRSGGATLGRWSGLGGGSADHRSTLAPEEALLAYALDEPAAVFVATRSGVRVVRLEANPSLRDQAALFSDLFAQGAGADADAAGASVSRTLLAPVLGALPSTTRRLLIAATGDLAELPFGALPHPSRGTPLLDHFEVSYIPSLQFIAVLRGAGPPSGEGALVLSDPLSGRPGASSLRGPALGPLPYALREGREVAAYFPVHQLFEGVKATPRAVVTEGRRHSALHFASHAVTDRLAPMNSALVLSPEDGSRSGWLTAREIYALSLDSALVTLSACRSSTGPLTRAASVPSLARAFLYAGSRAVVAGLWDADDEATQSLMRLFYDALSRGQTVGAALSQAQREMSRSHNPAHWAGFVVVGDPQARLRGITRRSSGWMLGGGIGLGVLGLFWTTATILRRRRGRSA
jgi:CHAT domain-containing protein/tetratricopeptide (TPR) repeat protein